METTAEPPQEPSDNANDVVSEDSSPETDLNDHQNSPETNLPPSSETQSPLPNTTLDAPVSDSQDDSSDPIQPPQNPNSTFPAPPPKNDAVENASSPKSTAILPSAATELAVASQKKSIRWRSNVSVWLTGAHALESIRAEHKALVDSAYKFLLQHGYINFGVALSIKEAQLKLNEGAERANVVVVGAGLAGLVAARQLMAMGFKVVVLEGRARPGGRVKTMKMKGEGVVAAADLGGSVLTGINGNPLGVLARQMGLPLHKVRDICPLYLPDGKAVDSEIDSRIEASFNKLLDRVCKLRHAMIEEVKSVDVNLGTALEAFRHVYKVAEDPQELMLLNWHLANLEYANASLMSNLSMAYWDQDDPYEMGGDHCFIPGGNDNFVRELAKDLPIFYEKTVESIRYGVDGVIVYAGGQGFRGDMKGSIEFVPELPQRKKDAIQRLGYGLLNKVALLFPYNFWGGEIDTFGHLKEDPSMRGEFFLFYSYSSVSGGALLIALVAGDAAVKFERMSPVESVKRVLSILRDPVQSVCTRWGKDCFTYGSYSYVAVGSSGDDYDILAESVGDGRVFFAGEATNKQYPATMHGAFLSGMREAANILRVANRRSLSATDKGNNGLEENDDLNELYDTPNLKFGSFSILFDPRSNDGESFSLLRVKFQGGESDSCVLCLYGLISRKQAVELSELQDDGKRMEMLYNNFQIRLVGRKGLPNAGESLLTYIKEARSKLNLGN
ncbi:amine oxidase family protein [Salix suchowensis]|nr:amine oxidase family protein [Salix suchowensis]